MREIQIFVMKSIISINISKSGTLTVHIHVPNPNVLGKLFAEGGVIFIYLIQIQHVSINFCQTFWKSLSKITGDKEHL